MTTCARANSKVNCFEFGTELLEKMPQKEVDPVEVGVYNIEVIAKSH
jgi:hypothetical protein